MSTAFSTSQIVVCRDHNPHPLQRHVCAIFKYLFRARPLRLHCRARLVNNGVLRLQLHLARIQCQAFCGNCHERDTGKRGETIVPVETSEADELFEEVRQNDVEAAPTLLLERLFVCGRGRTESLRPAFCCTLSTFTYTHNKRVHPKFHLIATFCTSYTAQLHRSHTQ